MKRVRRKVTIGNTSKCVTRSKKRAESDPFYKFSLDLIIKILLILPAKSIAKLIFVSKLWSSIICGKDFTESYMTRSLTRPRLLFTISHGAMRNEIFHFSSEEDPSSAHHRVSFYTSKADNFYDFTPPIRGLICCLNNRRMVRIHSTRVMIGNPTTGQFITLSSVNTSKRVVSFFGYDPASDLYKVLCMTVASPNQLGSLAFVTKEHQVFTLGYKQKWRMIECKHLHSLSRGNKGLCNNGVVYYLAWISYDVQSVMCFDLGSESFNVIKLPGNIKAEFLANYSEKIAVTSMLFDGRLDLWVLDDASKQEWSKISIIVMFWRDLVGNHSFKFKGTFRTGELIFEPCYSKPYFLLFLDLKKKTARNVLIEGFGTAYTSAEVFLNEVESPMFLKIR